MTSQEFTRRSNKLSREIAREKRRTKWEIAILTVACVVFSVVWMCL